MLRYVAEGTALVAGLALIALGLEFLTGLDGWLEVIAGTALVGVAGWRKLLWVADLGLFTLADEDEWEG